MNEIVLKLEKRTIAGRKLPSLRDSDIIPGVVYGGHDEPMMVQSPKIEITKVVKSAGKHTPVNLLINGKKKLAIIKSIDIDPVKHILRHVAFHTIKQDEIITTEVPLILTGLGESAAEKAGLVILQAIEHIEVKAKPADLPESIEISVLDLATTEDKVTVANIKLPVGVEFADVDQDLELVIANVYEPSALQAANEATGGEAEEEAEVPTEGDEETEQTTENEKESAESSETEPKEKNYYSSINPPDWCDHNLA